MTVGTAILARGTTSRLLDARGEVYASTLPDGSRIINRFGTDGRLTSIGYKQTATSAEQVLATYSTYDERERPQSVQFANGVRTTRAFDPATGRVTSIAAAGSATVLSQAFQYDSAGVLRRLEDRLTPALTATFAYDKLYRLRTASRQGGRVFRYDFDAASNLVAFDGIGRTFEPMTNRLRTHGSSNSFAWAESGNLLQRDNNYYGYDHANRLSTVARMGQTVTRNLYDTEGGRRYKLYRALDGSEVRTFYFGAYELRETWAGSTLRSKQSTTYVSGDDGNVITTITRNIASLAETAPPVALSAAPRVSRLPAQTTLILVLVGCLLAIVVLRRARGASLYPALQWARGARRQWRRTTMAVVCVAAMGCQMLPQSPSESTSGALWVGSAGTSLGLPVGTFFHVRDYLGSAAALVDMSGRVVERIVHTPYGGIDLDASSNASGDFTTRKYTGQELDQETELYNYGARFYDPAIGSFLTADTVVANAEVSLDYNRYLYARGNPVIYNDPTGHFAFLVAVGIGALVGALSHVGLSLAQGQRLTLGGILSGALSGAISGAVGAGIGGFLPKATSVLEAAKNGALQGGGTYLLGGGINASATGRDPRLSLRGLLYNAGLSAVQSAGSTALANAKARGTGGGSPSAAEPPGGVFDATSTTSASPASTAVAQPAEGTFIRLEGPITQIDPGQSAIHQPSGVGFTLTRDGLYVVHNPTGDSIPLTAEQARTYIDQAFRSFDQSSTNALVTNTPFLDPLGIGVGLSLAAAKGASSVSAAVVSEFRDEVIQESASSAFDAARTLVRGTGTLTPGWYRIPDGRVQYFFPRAGKY